MWPMTTDHPRRVVICAIACNEAPFVEGFVQTARERADLVYVGDTGSTDDTAQRLRDGGATVIDVPRAVLFRGGFAAARNYVLDHIPAAPGYVHWLDLDERITAEGDGLPRTQPYGDVITRTYTFDPDIEVADWPSLPGRSATDEGHTRIHPNRPDVRWAGLVHEELWGSWHQRERVGVIHHHLTHFGSPERKTRQRGLYTFLLWRGLTVRALRRGTNPWWFTDRVRALSVDALASERDDARRFYEENRADIDFEVDWRVPGRRWWSR
jgi:glycosyltransferase involved in cell wall biosynthesis